MTLAATIRSKLEPVVERLGITAQLVSRSSNTYAPSTGLVTENETSTTVRVAGPVNEARRYADTGADSRVVATFYMLSGQGVVPQQGDEIVFQQRTWQVVTRTAFGVNGFDVAWQLDCAEGAAP